MPFALSGDALARRDTYLLTISNERPRLFSLEARERPKGITSIRHNAQVCNARTRYQRLRQWHLRKHDERARKIALYRPR